MNTKRLYLAVLACSSIAASGGAFAQQVVYDALPTPLPGNVPSQGFECCSASEVGDHVRLALGPRRLVEVVVTMSSWACESGGWTGGCSTTPGSTFTHPITLNIYAVDNSTSPPKTGQLLATKTVTFTMPYRPSADPTNCEEAPTKWKAPDGICYNGKAFDIAFDMSDLDVTLPNELIWGVAYNTSHHGYIPLGGSGGPYDSLNVGTSPAATVGTDVDPDAAFFNTSYAPFYCDGGVAGVNVFRYDGGCWTGYVPAAQITTALPVPGSADQCKKDGWLHLARTDGTTFKNQGDCVSYTQNGK